MKVILVTGASSGIGYDTAALLASQGHVVYGAARRVEKIEPLRDKGVIPVKLDVTSQESIDACVAGIIAGQGRIDVLVNNAGYGSFGAVENVSMEEARRQVEVNVFGLASLCRKVLPYMREEGAGRIINVASIAGKITMYFGAWYHVSKFAVEGFSEALRMEMKPYGIDVSIIEPGGIKTDWGLIASEHLKASSAGTPYEKEGFAEADFLHWAYSINLLSKPSVISKAISKAVNSRRPRCRYRVGFGAGILVFLHSVLPGRCYDALIRSSARFLADVRRKDKVKTCK